MILWSGQSRSSITLSSRTRHRIVRGLSVLVHLYITCPLPNHAHALPRHTVLFPCSADIILGAGGYIEPGTVFIDENPAVKASEKFKMVATSGGGAKMFSSADGFLFKPMTAAPCLKGSDTQDVVFFDARHGQYVYYGRTHERGSSPPCPRATQQPGRSIGRMLLGLDVASWPIHSADQVPTIFNVDKDDTPCMDIYLSLIHI